MGDFKASSGLIHHFCERTVIGNLFHLYSKVGRVETEKEEMIPLRKKLHHYSPEMIYNQDETDLFYELLPNETYLAPREC